MVRQMLAMMASAARAKPRLRAILMVPPVFDSMLEYTRRIVRFPLETNKRQA
jgi:hypothetical protein